MLLQCAVHRCVHKPAMAVIFPPLMLHVGVVLPPRYIVKSMSSEDIGVLSDILPSYEQYIRWVATRCGPRGVDAVHVFVFACMCLPVGRGNVLLGVGP